MQWSEHFDRGQEPSAQQIREFVSNPLWDRLTEYFQQTCHLQPQVCYSGCSMDHGFWKGWNVKYRKSSKSLCTLYPKQGDFVVLINVGPKEAVEADLLIPFCDPYTQDIYKQAKVGKSGRALALHVTSENILHDVTELVALRAGFR
jgi:hypothetical protein